MSEMQAAGNSTLTDALAGFSVVQIVRQKRPIPGARGHEITAAKRPFEA